MQKNGTETIYAQILLRILEQNDPNVQIVLNLL